MAEIILNWIDPNIGNLKVDGFNVFRDTNPFDTGSLPPVFASLGPDAASFSDATAVDGTRYYYAVESVADGLTQLSQIVHTSGDVAPPVEVIPASVTHFVKPTDMIFAGGVLTGVNDRVSADSSYFTVAGSPTGNSVDGFAVTEAGSDYGVLSSTLGSQYLSIHIQRNNTADNAAMLFGAPSATWYVGVGQVGSTSSTASGIHVFKYRINGADVVTVNRDEFWNYVFNDTAPHVVGVDMNITSDLYIGKYPSAAGFSYEGTIKGWAMFTDWADADAVEAALLL